jgi:hypothetical protein
VDAGAVGGGGADAAGDPQAASKRAVQRSGSAASARVPTRTVPISLVA